MPGPNQTGGESAVKPQANQKQPEQPAAKPADAPVKPAEAAAQPAAKRAEKAEKSVEPERKADDPYPSQADLDAMREGRFGAARRDMASAESSAHYKIR